jgi:hypothetical protein
MYTSKEKRRDIVAWFATENVSEKVVCERGSNWLDDQGK